MPLFRQRFNQTAVAFRAWMGDNMLLFYVNVITYPCLYRDAGLAKLCQ